MARGENLYIWSCGMITKAGRNASVGEENTVYIGNKPTMNYVLAVVTQFNNGSKDVTIKARGRAISRAVDVAEIVRHRFIQEAAVRDIKIETEVLKSESGGTANVSSIEIYLSR
jgi:archaea-specific DNA-binding protein